MKRASLLKYAAAALAPLATSLAAAPTVAGQGDPSGQTHQCISLSDVEQTPTIDSRTLLVEMEGTAGYKRIDLTGPCSRLVYDGSVVRTSSGKLCASDPMQVPQVPEPTGRVCVIDKIVAIGEDEARSLLAKRRPD